MERHSCYFRPSLVVLRTFEIGSSVPGHNSRVGSYPIFPRELLSRHYPGGTGLRLAPACFPPGDVRVKPAVFTCATSSRVVYLGISSGMNTHFPFAESPSLCHWRGRFAAALGRPHGSEAPRPRSCSRSRAHPAPTSFGRPSPTLGTLRFLFEGESVADALRGGNRSPLPQLWLNLPHRLVSLGYMPTRENQYVVGFIVAHLVVS